MDVPGVVRSGNSASSLPEILRPPAAFRSSSRAVGGQVLRADGGSVETKEPAALEDAVDDGVGEVVIVKDVAPSSRVLVRGEDHRATADGGGR